MPTKEDLFSPFDLILAQIGASKSSIFNILDEFTVYCYYIEEVLGSLDIKIGENLRSPLREDDTNPSFRLYYAKGELLFTDYGKKNKTGDVVNLVAEIYNITYEQALKQISADFALSSNNSTNQLPVRKQVVKNKKKLGVTVKSFTNQDLTYWNSFGVHYSTLKRYNVSSVEYVLWDDYPIKPRGLAFAYRIGNYIKVYSPFDKNHKFISSFPRNYVEGMLQLTYSKALLIITKSLKDVMVLHELGYEAVAPKSENTVIPVEMLSKLETKYDKIITFFDNDLKHKAEEYPYPLIMLPLPGPKDISDYVKANGIYKAREIINKLICY